MNIVAATLLAGSLLTGPGAGVSAGGDQVHPVEWKQLKPFVQTIQLDDASNGHLMELVPLTEATDGSSDIPAAKIRIKAIPASPASALAEGAVVVKPLSVQEGVSGTAVETAEAIQAVQAIEAIKIVPAQK